MGKIRKVSGTIVISILLSLSSLADEGMWIPSLIEKLNMVEMNKLGCELKADDIYSASHSSMKDAVIALDGGRCTGEIISDKGLFITNHHCGYSDLQSISTIENNIIQNGFWASQIGDEIPITGKTVSIISEIVDVTEEVNASLNDTMLENVRKDSILRISNRIEKQYTQNNHLKANVRSMFEGNQFFLIVYRTFKDIRLVGAPPRFIGKFGADTDNWMWPRHTGDFCLFRIYSDTLGNPSAYDQTNIPYTPDHYFPININGYQENDFTMTMGFPGTTTRYLTSHEVNLEMKATNEVRSIVRSAKLDIMKADMQANEEIFLKYAGNYSSSSNYYKYSVGQNKAFEKLGTVSSKRDLEMDFNNWISSKADSEYKNVLPALAESFKNIEYTRVNDFITESFIYGPGIFFFSARFNEVKRLTKKYKSDDEYYQLRMNRLKKIMNNHFDEYNTETDRKIVAQLAATYTKNVKRKYYPDFIKKAINQYDGDFDQWSNDLFNKSIFATKDKLAAFLDKPKARKLEKDPALKAMQEIYNMRKKVNDQRTDNDKEVDKNKRLWVKGLMEMNQGKTYYPDANSTLRMSYGTIGGYQPADAVQYKYYTTIDGKISKGIPGDYEFDIWPEYEELYRNKDFGKYVDADGTLHTCFITNNDITGGSSGSPVLNARGELIGVAFDGNWESMSGDIQFEPELQKCIAVDIRYVLWVIDKFSNAGHIIDEMEIID